MSKSLSSDSAAVERPSSAETGCVVFRYLNFQSSRAGIVIGRPRREQISARMNELKGRGNHIEHKRHHLFRPDLAKYPRFHR